jgi:protein gp37
MAENSGIEWTSNTWNPWIGCTKVSAGCAHCYAETLMDERYGKVQWGPHGTRVRTTSAYWRKPILWDVAAVTSRRRVRVFPSLCDPFEDWQGPIHDSKGDRLVINGNGVVLHVTEKWEPCWQERLLTMDNLRAEMFALIDATPHLDWLLLTKRPENVLRMWPPLAEADGGGMFRSNVWIGTSVENQETADERIPELVKCRELSPVLWISYEPAIGPVQFALWLWALDWLICGGESGKDARPCNILWFGKVLAECRSARVPCFVKQLGARPFIGTDLGTEVDFCTDPKGGNWDEWPIGLRVRQYPKTAGAQLKGG